MLPAEACARILILGNSGAGKSWLAARLAPRLASPDIDLDHIHWEPGGYGHARDKAAARALVEQAAAGERWIIEGVYGRLAQIALPRATALIWVRLPVEECLANLRRRGVRRGAGAEELHGLMCWAGDYDRRDDSSARAGHAALFAAFTGPKIAVSSRAEMAALLAGLD